MPKRVVVVVKRSSWSQRVSSGEPLPAGWKRKALASHKQQQRIRDRVLDLIRGFGVKPWIVEGAETAFNARGADLVVSVGGDGTLLSASHYVGKEPLLGINNDPGRSEGHFCVDTSDDLSRTLEQALKDPCTHSVTRMRVSVGRRVVADRVLNEALFSHTCPAAMTRFQLGSYKYACSGVWVGTGAGSTGALASAGGEAMPLSAHKLQAVIREPFKEYDGNVIRYQSRSIRLTSLTDDATLYLDGPFLRVPVGLEDVVVFDRSPSPLNLVMNP